MYRYDTKVGESEISSGVLDLVLYWQNRVELYPRLARLALVTLSVSATSVALEQMFSHTGQIADKKRVAMRVNYLKALAFTYFNSTVENI